jgi:uncharacterized membrane protein
MLKIKTFNELVIINILTLLLIVVIHFIHYNLLQIFLGIPFLLFFPGYVLISVLFARKDGLNRNEKIALSFGMSIVVTPLIGFVFNYTSWGISLESMLYAISAFIIVGSIIALIQRRHFKTLKLISEHRLNFPSLYGSTFNKILSVILGLAILGAVVVVIYAVAFPKTGEKYTEFYMLGPQGKAVDYPTNFILNGHQIVSVQYGTEVTEVNQNAGDVIIGIVNHEQQETDYSISLEINGNQTSIIYLKQQLSKIGPIRIDPEGKWEQAIGFAPQQIGANQKVELRLYKNNGTDPYLTLHLWVNVMDQ